MAQKENSQAPGQKAKGVRIRWTGFDESPLIFSNSMVVQHTPHEFVLSFAQVQPPFTPDLTPQKKDSITTLTSRVVVRLVMPPPRMKELIDILSENYNRYLERFSGQEVPKGNRGKSNA